MTSVEQAPIKQGTRVLVRCDLDVSIKNGQIHEPYRLESALDTLKLIIRKGGVPIIVGHIGKPKEAPLPPELSTKQLLPFFNEKLGEEKFELWENVRIDPREESNDDEYAKTMASQAELYVNESFATSHRQHASICAITKYLPSYAGLRLEKEIKELTLLISNPELPFTAIIGGAKLESKMPVVSKFLQTANHVLLGGKLGTEWKQDVPSNLVLPIDYAQDQKDIGNQTISKFEEIILESKTIVWAGPLGVYEEVEFAKGTNEIVQAIVQATKDGAHSVIGGGDTIVATNSTTNLDNFSFVSTGGGAMLQFLAEGTLPGIEVLN